MRLRSALIECRECPNCQQPNPSHWIYCTGCRYPFTKDDTKLIARERLILVGHDRGSHYELKSLYHCVNKQCDGYYSDDDLRKRRRCPYCHCEKIPQRPTKLWHVPPGTQVTWEPLEPIENFIGVYHDDEHDEDDTP